MRKFKDKRQRVEDIKEAIHRGRLDLHPQEHAEACRELEIYCQKEAARQESHNEVNGVPERE